MSSGPDVFTESKSWTAIDGQERSKNSWKRKFRFKPGDRKLIT